MIGTLAACCALGLLTGRLLPPSGARARWIARVQTALVVVLLVILGVRLGLRQAAAPDWSRTLLRSLVLAAGSVAGSLVFVYPIRGWLEPEGEEAIRMQSSHLPALPGTARLVGASLGCLGAGTLAGLVLAPTVDPASMDAVAFQVLCVLLFACTLEAGSDRDAGSTLAALSPRLALVPLAIAAGSIAGAGLCGLALGLRTREGGAVGAGCGWYSLTTLILGRQAGPDLASCGLLANLLRESLAFVVIPVIARHHRGLMLIAPAGCTAMDTTLPILGRLGGNRVGVLGFLTGAALSLLVPVIVPWAYRTLP
jgi:uncharacterized membrane protein YbjE (DUF340 family)